MPHRIFLDVDGNETRREPMKRGRPPTGSYKDAEGNLICPMLVMTQPVVKKIATAQDNITKTVDVDKIRKAKKIESTDAESRITLEEFMGMFHPVSNPEHRDGIIFIREAYVKKHFYLYAYKKDLFNGVPPLIVIDPKENIIRIWTWYGPKKEDEQGNVYYDFEAISPTYVIKNLLRPDEQH